MKQRIIYLAAVLLIIQVGLIVALNRGGSTLDAVTPDTPFAEFTPNSITGIEITDSDNQQLTLEKKDNEWVITSAFSAPADGSLVKDLLSKLAEAKQGFAVATSSGAAERFTTGRDDFERHIIIKKGEQIITDFYLGKSAGMGKSHVRRAGEQEVFALTLSSFEVEANADKWLDKKYFQLNKESLKRVKLTDFELQKEGGSWQIAGNGAEDLKTDEVENLITAIAQLQVQSVLDPDEVSSLFEGEPDFQCSVSTDKDKSIQYTFVAKDDFHVLKISTSEFYFKVHNWQVDKLKSFTKETLIKAKDHPAQAETTELDS